MAEHGFLGHDGSDGSTPADRAYAAGYPEEQESARTWPKERSGSTSTSAGAVDRRPQREHAHAGVARDRNRHGTKGTRQVALGDVLRRLRRLRAAGGRRDATPRRPHLAANRGVRRVRPRRPSRRSPRRRRLPSRPFLPTTAFTLSHARPRAGGNVTFTNRSDVAAVLELAGRERAARAGRLRVACLHDVGPQVVRLRTPDGGASVARTLQVLPPRGSSALTYTGPGTARAGRPLTRVRAGGRPRHGDARRRARARVRARRAPRSPGDHAQSGLADRELDLAGLAAGFHQLVVRFAGDGTTRPRRRTRSCPCSSTRRRSAHAGGPYTAGEGADVLLDGSRSTDADAAFGDAVSSWSGTSTATAPSTTPRDDRRRSTSAAICGGACETGRDYPVALRVTDRRGDSAIAAATVRFTADFAVALAGRRDDGRPRRAAEPLRRHRRRLRLVDASRHACGCRAPRRASPRASASTPSPRPGTSVLTLTATGGAQTGRRTVTVPGTSNGLTRTTDGSLSVAFGLVPQCFGTITGVVRDRDTGRAGRRRATSSRSGRAPTRPAATRRAASRSGSTTPR